MPWRVGPLLRPPRPSSMTSTSASGTPGDPDEAPPALGPDEIAARIAAPAPVLHSGVGPSGPAGWLTGALLLVLASALLWWMHARTPPPASAHTSVSDAPAESGLGWPTVPNGEPAAVRTPSIDPADLREQIARSPSHLAFANVVHAPARTGDAHAQFALWTVLDACAWHRAGRQAPSTPTSTTLEAALRQALVPTGGEARLRERLAVQCKDLTAAEAEHFGPPRDWLERAADGGVPEAMALLALEGVQDTPRSLRRVAFRGASLPEESMRLVAGALRSREGAVFWILSEHPVLLAIVPGATSLDTLAWKLIGCRRGLDCNQPSWTVHRGCREVDACRDDESAAAWIRRHAGTDLPQVEGRALVLARHVDLDQWPMLGLPQP